MLWALGIILWLIIGFAFTTLFVYFSVKWNIEDNRFSSDIALSNNGSFYAMGIFLWPITTPIWFFLSWDSHRSEMNVKNKKYRFPESFIRKKLTKKGVI